jgi:hypothetical protein
MHARYAIDRHVPGEQENKELVQRSGSTEGFNESTYSRRDK